MALVLQMGHRRVDGLRARLFLLGSVFGPRAHRPLRRAGLPGPLAVDADDFLLLRLVDEVEERSVDVQQPLQRVLIEICNPICRLVPEGRVVVLFGLLTEGPQPFHVFEEGLPALFLRNLPEHAAQEIDLAAQGLGNAGAFRFEVEFVPAAHRESEENVKGV
jgi:hypothetical protein